MKRLIILLLFLVFSDDVVAERVWLGLSVKVKEIFLYQEDSGNNRLRIKVDVTAPTGCDAIDTHKTFTSSSYSDLSVFKQTLVSALQSAQAQSLNLEFFYDNWPCRSGGNTLLYGIRMTKTQ